MIIFNTTFHIENEVHDQCLAFLKDVYIKMAINGGLLHSPHMARVHPQHEESGISYALEFRVKNIDTLNYWFEKEGGCLQQELVKLFGTKVAGFITLLDEVDLGI